MDLRRITQRLREPNINGEQYALHVGGMGNRWLVRIKDPSGKDYEELMSCNSVLSVALFEYEQRPANTPLPMQIIEDDSILMRALREVGCELVVTWTGETFAARLKRIGNSNHEREGRMSFSVWRALHGAFETAGEILVTQHRLMLS